MLAFVAPRWSHRPQLKIDHKLARGQEKAARAPGALGRVVPKPFGKSRKAANKSADAGRKSRLHLPF